MNINTNSQKYIFIELSRSDMEKLGLSFSSLDYSDSKTRETIFSVLYQAKCSLRQNFELSDTISVEALPRENGGCLLFFTLRKRAKRYKVIKSLSGVCYKSGNIDSFLDFAAALTSEEVKSVKSGLYLSDGIYYLRLSGRLHKKILMKLCEYASNVRNDEMPSENELECVIENNALEILCGSVSE